jgi:hypothetical protein
LEILDLIPQDKICVLKGLTAINYYNFILCWKYGVSCYVLKTDKHVQKSYKGTGIQIQHELSDSIVIFTRNEPRKCTVILILVQQGIFSILFILLTEILISLLQKWKLTIRNAKLQWFIKQKLKLTIRNAKLQWFIKQNYK